MLICTGEPTNMVEIPEKDESERAKGAGALAMVLTHFKRLRVIFVSTQGT